MIADFFTDRIKNLFGWKTKRKIVVFAVDDYGCVRLHSSNALQKLSSIGMKPFNRFDHFDSLETREDLEVLFTTLRTVKDMNGRHPVFTPFVLSLNPDFERILNDDCERYYSEPLPTTFEKLASFQPAYRGAWDLWLTGMNDQLLAPEFHGREHFHLEAFEERLQSRDARLLAMIKHRSLLTIRDERLRHRRFTASFSFEKVEDTQAFPAIIQDGVAAFHRIFNRKPFVFTPPAQQFPLEMESLLPTLGLPMMDKPFYQQAHVGNGKFARRINYSGKSRLTGLYYQVRNVVFEPTQAKGMDSINLALRQIEAAFRASKPAVISSHRVNFSGGIEVSNRNVGIESLKHLLKKITERWPDVEFMACAEVLALMEADYKNV